MVVESRDGMILTRLIEAVGCLDAGSIALRRTV